MSVDQNYKWIMKTSRTKYVKIGENNAGQRIDNFLITRLKGVPRSHIYKILRKGEVRVDKKRIKPTYKLNLHDNVRIPPIYFFGDKIHKPGASLLKLLKEATLFEDANMIVVNKPYGIAVHGGSNINLGVIESLRSLHPKHQYLELAHRLDKATSGCLIIAKKRSFLTHIQNEIRNQRVKKKYLALLHGQMKKQLRCSQPLVKSLTKSGERMVYINKNGKSATSIFTPIKVFSRTSLVEVDIITGRTHQIRAHSRHLNHSVIGNEKYGNKVDDKYFKTIIARRMFLHAKSLSFKNLDGSQFLIKSQVDKSFDSAIKTLEND